MKKKLLLILTVSIAAFMLFACGGKKEYADKSYTVMVTEINDGKYTALIGEAKENGDNFINGGTPNMPMHTFDPNMPAPTFDPNMPMHTFEPNMPMPTDEMKFNGNNEGIKPPPDGGVQINPLESEKPFFDGEMPPEVPNGETGMMPPDMMGSAVAFEATEESITFEIADNTEITKNGQAVSASEITVDSILNIAFDSSGNAAKIEILY